MHMNQKKTEWQKSRAKCFVAMLAYSIAGINIARAASSAPSLSPHQAWQPGANVWSVPSAVEIPEISAASDKVFSIPAIPQLPAASVNFSHLQGRTLDLPQLIDIAQRENTETRQAWNRAREAALSAGMTDTLFLPHITAHVVAGEQRVRVPVNMPWQSGSIDTQQRLNGVTPFVTLTWLLFDFGERKALQEGAQYVALAANILFNASHQKLIRDVTDAYYRYSAARNNLQLALQSLSQYKHVLQAVQARFDAGVATRMDIALAKQAYAQGRLDVVTHQGTERSSYLGLLHAMGLPSYAQLAIAEPHLDGLPASTAPLTQERLRAVVAQRADVAAAYAALKTAEAGQRTANAAFMPKVYLGATLAHNHSNFQAGNLGMGAQNTAAGILLGVSVPLYDGGMRANQLRKTALAQEQAQLHLQQLQTTAVREIVVAEQVLSTALQSYEAAQELVQTATVAYDAALESYKVGRISTILLTESTIQLHKAQQACAQAQYASVAAAANLAFVMGTMVSAQDTWWPQAASPSEPY